MKSSVVHPKKSNQISTFLDFDFPSRSFLFVLPEFVKSQCLSTFSFGILKFPIRYSTKSVSLINCFTLYSQYPTTSIHKLYLFIDFRFPRSLVPACRITREGSQHLATSSFGHIMKCTLAWADFSVKYFRLEEYNVWIVLYSWIASLRS